MHNQAGKNELLHFLAKKVFSTKICHNYVVRIKEINFIIKELTKTLKQTHFKLAGTKLDRVKTILENYLAEGYVISDFDVYHKANLLKRCQDDRHVKFTIRKNDVIKNIEISIEQV